MDTYTIYDAHAHIFPSKIAEKASGAIGEFYDIPMEYIGDAQVLLEKGAHIGVNRYLVCSTATRPTQVESINTFIADQCAQHPEFLGFATIHPDFDDIAAELDRAIALGLHGVKLHPDFQRFDIDASCAMRMYALLQERNLPVLVHTGDDRYDYSAPRRLRTIALAFPQLTLIGAHFGGYRAWEESETHLKLPNVYFDTSSSLTFITPEHAARLIHYFGADHFMFGSDFPMWDHEQEHARFLRIPLTDEERHQIFHRTFETLFLK